MTTAADPTPKAMSRLTAVPPRPLRVLQVVQRFLPELGGLETHVAEVTARLAAVPDIDVTILTTDRTGKLPREEWISGVRVIRRRSFPRKADLYFSPGLLGVIRGGGWDLIHVQGSQTTVPTVAMLAARLARIPYVVTFHSGGHSSVNHAPISRIQQRINRPLFARARALVAVSRFEQGRFQALTGLPAERFTVINNGGALPPVSTGVLPEAGRIVTSGRLEKYKGHHRAVRALPLIRRTIPQAKLTVLGSGPYEAELRRLTEELGVGDAVTFRHLLPGQRQEMADVLSRSAVMAALSDYEAHPVAVMEAVALGLPVVGCDIAGIADLVEDGLVTGIDAAASDEEVARVLTETLQAAQAAPHRAPDFALPTWESCTDEIANVYRKALDRPSGGVAAEARPLSVVQVITSLTTGGAERQLEAIVARSAHTHRTIALYAGGPIADSMTAAGHQVEVLTPAGSSRFSTLLLTLPRLIRRLRELRPDIVQVHLLTGQLWGLPAARLAGVRAAVSTEHSLMDDSIENRPLSARLRLLYLGLSRLAAVTVAVSAATAGRLERWGLPGGRIQVIDNGIDFRALTFSAAARTSVRGEFGVGADVELVGAIGRLEPVKRFPQLLAALAPTLVAGRRELLLVGAGPLLPALTEQAASLQVADCVHIVGARSDVSAVLSALDVLVSPSRDETFGMAVVEGLGAGLPVVYAQCPALDELAESPAAAWRLHPVDSSEAAEAVAIRAGVVDALRVGRPSGGRLTPPPALLDAFDIRRTAARLDELYQRLTWPRGSS